MGQLGIQAVTIAAALHRSFQYVAVQLTADLPDVDGLSLEGEGGMRAMTKEPAMRERSVVRLSVTPSTK